MRIRSTRLQPQLLAIILLLGVARLGSAQVTLEWGVVHMWVKGDASLADPDPAVDRGSGWEVRTRARYRFASLAAGMSSVRFAGNDAESPFFLVSYRLFPRIEARPGRRLNPFIEGNFGVHRGWANIPELDSRFEVSGRASGVGTGAVVSVRRWLSFEGGAEWGRMVFDHATIGGVPLSTADDSRSSSLRIRVAASWQLPRVFP